MTCASQVGTVHSPIKATGNERGARNELQTAPVVRRHAATDLDRFATGFPRVRGVVSSFQSSGPRSISLVEKTSCGRGLVQIESLYIVFLSLVRSRLRDFFSFSQNSRTDLKYFLSGCRPFGATCAIAAIEAALYFLAWLAMDRRAAARDSVSTAGIYDCALGPKRVFESGLETGLRCSLSSVCVRWRAFWRAYCDTSTSTRWNDRKTESGYLKRNRRYIRG